MSVPTGISLQEIEEFAAKNPDLYHVLSGIGRTLNDLLAYTRKATKAATAEFGPPKGPRNVAVTAVGSTIVVGWINDSSPNTIVGYKVFRAAAGTRSSPTSPTFTDGKFVGATLATEVCLGTQGSAYRHIDRNFAISDLDQANPARFAYWVTSIDSNLQESAPVPVTGSPIEVLTNGPGDQSSDVKDVALNKLYNSAFRSKATTAGLTLNTASSFTLVSNATNATPIQITTTTAHGLVTGDDAMIYGVLGNTAANGYWIITRIDNTNFTLNGSVGNGAFTSGGGVYPAQGGGRPAGELVQPPWGTIFQANYQPWFGTGGAEYRSNGSIATGEVRLPAPTAGNTASVFQTVAYALRPNQRFVFSVYLRMPTPATDMTITISADRGDGGFLREQSFSSSLLTSTYQRVVFNTGGINDFHTNVTVKARTNSGTGQDVYVFKPMMNAGDVPAGWTALADPDASANVGFESTPPWGRVTQSLIFRDSTAPYV